MRKQTNVFTRHEELSRKFKEQTHSIHRGFSTQIRRAETRISPRHYARRYLSL